MDWRSLVLSRCLSGAELFVAQLKANPNYATEAERVRAFIAKGRGSRSTYFNLCKKLPAPLTHVPSVQLKSQAPKRRAANQEMLRILRTSRGHFGDN